MINLKKLVRKEKQSFRGKEKILKRKFKKVKKGNNLLELKE